MLLGYRLLESDMCHKKEKEKKTQAVWEDWQCQERGQEIKVLKAVCW